MRYIMLGRAREIYYLHCVRKHARKKIEKKGSEIMFNIIM